MEEHIKILNEGIKFEYFDLDYCTYSAKTEHYTCARTKSYVSKKKQDMYIFLIMNVNYLKKLVENL